MEMIGLRQLDPSSALFVFPLFSAKDTALTYTKSSHCIFVCICDGIISTNCRSVCVTGGSDKVHFLAGLMVIDFLPELRFVSVMSHAETLIRSDLSSLSFLSQVE